ncbi:hypothetical protein DYB38_005568 [Aphanomyces astaci]|uniref:Uncharacterized protein n=1 Tax=Aphanomyces astaci TaxID=112090 RepID=A0A397CYP7_APHAT|nr:hypothetical protein DYB38_005568 [Aphanomyces astaci]
MPNTNRDDAQGPVDGGLKSLVKHNFHVAEATGQLNLAHMHLEQLPQSVQFLPRLVELDLSYNSLNRFPGQWVADHFKHLRVLAVEHNDLYCLDDILALSTLSKLESLNSFDGLANDQRCLVREKSKHSADASLKDNPFNANVVLDNMIQAERSRY